MVKDDNKTITAITYNHLNLPMKIIFANGGTIEYLYSATGQKVSKVVRENNTLCAGSFCTATTEYLDGFQYKNNVLLFFPQAEGYVNVAVVETTCITCKPARIISSTSFNYVYNYTDHLGNVRLSYGIDPGTGGLRIIEENNYYPFGEKHTNYNSDSRVLVGSVSKSTLRIVPAEFSSYYQYKYNGKELQDELGLNMYDYGARNYDPAIGRWMNIDVLAENYMNVSGYTYCLNNPLRFIDPTGMAVEEIEGGIRFTEDDAISAFNILTGKSKNAFVEVVGNKKTRNSMNNKDKVTSNGPWSVFAVENLGIGAKMLDAFSNSSLDNLVLSNHGGASSTDSYFEFGTNTEMNEHNSIITSEIASYNSKGGVNLSQGEQEVLAFVQMGSKVKNGGNFVFAFCSTGKGDIGQQTLSELKTLLGDRMNIFLPQGLVKSQHYEYSTGEGFKPNYTIDKYSDGWKKSTPGVIDSSTIQHISISPSSSNPLIFKR